MSWTTDELIAAVKSGAYLPPATDAALDADILSFATQVCRNRVTPVLCMKGSEYYARDADTAFVGGTGGYRLPARAVAGKLRDLFRVDAAGVKWPLTECSEENAFAYGVTPGTPIQYAFRGEHVDLLPPPAAAGETLRFRYYLRRPKLVAVSAAPQITAINTGTKTITVAAVPSNFSTLKTYDLIRNNGLCEHLGIDLTISAGTATDITFVATLPAELAIGDYVSLAGEASLICVPEEMHPAVLALTIALQLEATKDPAWKAKEERGLALLEAAAPLFAPRNDGRSARAMNLYSPLRQGTVRSWR